MTTATIEAPAPTTSRHASRRSPSGINVSESAAVASAYERLLDERIEATRPPGAPAKEVPLKRVIQTPDGYKLVSAGVFTGRQNAPVANSGRFQKRSKPAGPFLDALFAGDSPEWEQASTQAIYEASAELAAILGARGHDLARLNRAVSRLVLLRSGIVGPDNWDLP